MLILASQSPRRAELLASLTKQFNVQAADIDESNMVQESPTDYVQRLALAKAGAVLKLADKAVVLGSDTTVVVENSILGKPEDFNDFKQMMNKLSATTHQVHTAVAMVSSEKQQVVLVSTAVTFDSLSQQDINWYWQTGEPQDKAGGYGIQSLGGRFVKQIHGSYSSVVGLPLYETAKLLKNFGISLHEC